MKTLSMLVLVSLTWGMMATADVTLTNNFGGSPFSLYVFGYTDFGTPLPGTPTIIPVVPSGWGGWGGAVTSLSVSLLGLDYASPEDLEVWVQNPGGERSWLMGDAGDNSDCKQGAVNLTFSDSATVSVPASSVLSSGTFLPAAPYDPPPPATPGAPTPGEFSLTALIDSGSNITGDWLLFVFSDYADDGSLGGDLAEWSLTFGVASGGGGGGGGGGPGSNPGTPEPSALLLALAALTGLAVRRPGRC